MRKCIIAAVGLACIAAPASARWPADKPHTPEAKWFAEVHHNGISCCGEADGHRLDTSLVRVRDGHYEFRAAPEAFGDAGDNEWHLIPDDKLIRGRELAELGGNPLGEWAIFTTIYRRIGSDHAELTVICAVPPSAT